MSYPFGTVSSGVFSTAELHLLKPYMKSKCIRSESEFERAFDNLIKHQSDQKELASLIWNSVGKPIRAEFKNDLRTSLLAVNRAGGMYRLAFWQDAVSKHINNMLQRTVDENASYRDTVVFDAFGVQIGIKGNLLTVSIGQYSRNLPVSVSTIRDLAKLVKYLDKLVATSIRYQLVGVVSKPVLSGDTVLLGIYCGNDKYIVSSDGALKELGQSHCTALALDSAEVESQFAHFYSQQLRDHFKSIAGGPQSAFDALQKLVGWEALKPKIDSTTVGYIKTGSSKLPVTKSLYGALLKDTHNAAELAFEEVGIID